METPPIQILFDDDGKRVCSTCFNRRTDIRENNNCCDRCISYGKEVYKKKKLSLQVPIICECGTHLKKYSKLLQLRSKKHALLMTEKENVNVNENENLAQIISTN